MIGTSGGCGLAGPAEQAYITALFLPVWLGVTFLNQQSLILYLCDIEAVGVDCLFVLQHLFTCFAYSREVHEQMFFCSFLFLPGFS